MADSQKGEILVDLIHVDMLSPIVKPRLWFVVSEPFSTSMHTIFPPRHPALFIHIKTSCHNTFSLSDVLVRQGSSRVYIPQQVTQMVHAWITEWFKNDKLPMDHIETQSWMKSVCTVHKTMFSEVNCKTRFSINTLLDPISYADRNYGVNIVRRFYPNFTPLPYHFNIPDTAGK